MRHDYPKEFEALWGIYPKRAGSNPKIKAYKAYLRRIKEGYKYLDILQGLQRYAAYCQLTGLLRSEYILMAATFLGPDEYFLEEWELPVEKTVGTLQEKAARLGISAKPGESWEQFERRVGQTRG